MISSHPYIPFERIIHIQGLKGVVIWWSHFPTRMCIKLRSDVSPVYFSFITSSATVSEFINEAICLSVCLCVCPFLHFFVRLSYLGNIDFHRLVNDHLRLQWEKPDWFLWQFLRVLRLSFDGQIRNDNNSNYSNPMAKSLKRQREKHEK